MKGTLDSSHREEIRTFLEFISTGPGELVEMRAFGPQNTKFSGIFDNPMAMARNAASLNRDGLVTSTYFTLNALAPEAILNPRALNTVNRRPRHTASDSIIKSRRLYLIDVDPVRPSGNSATDDEKGHAYAVIQPVREYLGNLGWPEPIYIDSGNGLHLIYKGDGCESRSGAWAHVLKSLDRMFSTTAAKVDTSVANPSRISRLPGTWNRKGDDTPDRPHRRAKVLDYPSTFDVLLRSQVETLAAEMDYMVPKRRVNKSGTDVASAKASGSIRLPPSAQPSAILQDVAGREQDRPLLLLDERDIHRLIEEYPDQLHLDYSVHRDDGIYFFLAECPFKGAAHSNQTRKTAIILRPAYIGFRCFSDDCDEHTFGALVKLLKKKTGRSPSMQIWKNSETSKDSSCAALGSDPPAIQRYEDTLKETSAWKYDHDTWLALNSPEFLECPLGTDPSSWGIALGTLTPYFVDKAILEIAGLDGEEKTSRHQELLCVLQDHDGPKMGRYLGKEWLFAISRLQAGAIARGDCDADPGVRLITPAVFKFRMG